MPPIPPRSLIRTLLAGLFLLTAAGRLCADARRPVTPPVPVARPAQAEAVRGFPVEIRLNGVTGSGRVLQFIVRQAPKHGRLEGPPLQTGKDSAAVRYIANPGSTAEMDRFTYAVKVEGSGSSDEATVTIRLADPSAQIEAPGGVDLGRVLATELVERPIPILNKGNAPFRATVPVPEGWSWVVPPAGQFDLAPGGRIEAVVRLRVKEAGAIDEIITLRPGQVVRFVGRAVPPFLGYPSLLVLQWERGTTRRAYHFKVHNNRAVPQTVRMSTPPGVEVPASVTIPVADSVEVNVVCTGDLSQNLSGKIRLDAPGWSQDLAFEAPAAPAAVEITGAGPGNVVDFGILDKAVGDKAVRQLTFRNGGGTPALINWHPLRFFVVEGMDPETVLAPGAECIMTLRPHPDEPGRLKEELTLRMPGGDRNLQLLADIDPKAAQAALMSGKVLNVQPSVPSGNPQPAAVSSRQGLQSKVKLLSRGIYVNDLKTDRSLPRVESVNLMEAKPDRLVFDWAAPGPGKWTYRVLVRMLRNHGPQQVPIPEYDQMDNVKVTSTPTGGRAEVGQLRAEARWICAIVAIREDGVATAIGPDLTFLTPPMPDSRWGWRVTGILGAFALALYVRQKWREDVKWKD